MLPVVPDFGHLDQPLARLIPDVAEPKRALIGRALFSAVHGIVALGLEEKIDTLSPAQIAGQVATIGLAALVHLAAVLSISIGLLNLFPVPLLDGGHLLFYAVEAVRGRPLSERAQEMGFRIGLGLVLMLMVFATYNDILHLAAS